MTAIVSIKKLTKKFGDFVAVTDLSLDVEEGEVAGRMGGHQLFQEQAPEQVREHAHVEEEARPAGNPFLAIG